MAKKKRKKKERLISESLREAIEQSEMSRYRICQLIGLDPPVLHRFVHGESGLSVKSIDALGEVLGLELKVKEAE